jgi:hypothetical protein
MLQGWCSALPTAELVAFINLLIEAAGPRRVEWLDDLIVQADNQRRRTGAWKMNRLKQYAEAMSKNPRHLPRLRKLRGWPDSKVVLKTLEAAARGMSADEILPAFRRHRAITRGALVNVLISMTRNGLIERYSDGIYGVPRSEGERYESIPRRIFKLVLAVPETTRAALIGSTGCSSGSVSGAIWRVMLIQSASSPSYSRRPSESGGVLTRAIWRRVVASPRLERLRLPGRPVG